MSLLDAVCSLRKSELLLQHPHPWGHSNAEATGSLQVWHTRNEQPLAHPKPCACTRPSPMPAPSLPPQLAALPSAPRPLGVAGRLGGLGSNHTEHQVGPCHMHPCVKPTAGAPLLLFKCEFHESMSRQVAPAPCFAKECQQFPATAATSCIVCHGSCCTLAVALLKLGCRQKTQVQVCMKEGDRG